VLLALGIDAADVAMDSKLVVDTDEVPGAEVIAIKH
jgi:hypothetical protein